LCDSFGFMSACQHVRSYGEVAEIIGITRQAVQRLERSALEKLRAAYARQCPNDFRLLLDAQNRPAALVEVSGDDESPPVTTPLRRVCNRSPAP